MQRVEMPDEVWVDLLARRNGHNSDGNGGNGPNHRLYGPLVRRERPFVLAQVGQSLDGRVATPAGDARDVSGSGGIAHLHRCRALMDAVIVGVGTIVSDDPSLSVRAVTGPSPVRVVIDCNGRMPMGAKFLSDGGERIIVIQADDVDVRPANAEIIRLPRTERGLDVADILQALRQRELRSVLVEGGARTVGRFLDADAVDRLHVAISPMIIGSGPTGILLPPVHRLTDARRPKVDVYDMGTDILFDCDFRANGG
ncbi:RibD family protein [Phyllobacterium sp. 21LDTY02-6]|uniref:RibD family protein n=1 Tax=Phyllobacterium sp. 21LDTY02-6 TaxID=2944903 RepID=UPI002020E481|nr:RibD family protein [Phyllobacterium sp. 21LDTY02-6]MCO4318233.1 RibD family protein [Phyllobacterium sp. 21LDTY02-6]